MKKRPGIAARPLTWLSRLRREIPKWRSHAGEASCEAAEPRACCGEAQSRASGSAACAPCVERSSIIPALGVGDKKVAKDLDARNVAHLFGIDEKAIVFRHLRLRQQAQKRAVFVDEIIRQNGNPNAGEHASMQRGDVVDRQR